MITESNPKIEPHDLAFPNDEHGQTGMTIREYYAGQAMQALLSNPAIVKRSVRSEASTDVTVTPADVAKCAVVHADALIEYLNTNSK